MSRCACSECQDGKMSMLDEVARIPAAALKANEIGLVRTPEE